MHAVGVSKEYEKEEEEEEEEATSTYSTHHTAPSISSKQ